MGGRKKGEEAEAAQASTGAPGSGQGFVVADFADFDVHDIGLAHGCGITRAGARPPGLRRELLKTTKHHGFGFLAGDQRLQQTENQHDQAGAEQADGKYRSKQPQHQAQGET
jgi:hypothetical protein